MSQATCLHFRRDRQRRRPARHYAALCAGPCHGAPHRDRDSSARRRRPVVRSMAAPALPTLGQHAAGGAEVAGGCAHDGRPPRTDDRLQRVLVVHPVSESVGCSHVVVAYGYCRDNEEPHPLPVEEGLDVACGEITHGSDTTRPCLELTSPRRLFQLCRRLLEFMQVVVVSGAEAARDAQRSWCAPPPGGTVSRAGPSASPRPRKRRRPRRAEPVGTESPHLNTAVPPEPVYADSTTDALLTYRPGVTVTPVTTRKPMRPGDRRVPSVGQSPGGDCDASNRQATHAAR